MFEARIVVCYIVHTPVCPSLLAFGIADLGITNISFSARLFVSWGRRVESYIKSKNFDL